MWLENALELDNAWIKLCSISKWDKKKSFCEIEIPLTLAYSISGFCEPFVDK